MIDYERKPRHYTYTGKFKTAIIFLAAIEGAVAALFCIWWLILKYKLKIILKKREYLKRNSQKKKITFWDQVYINFFLALFF